MRRAADQALDGRRRLEELRSAWEVWARTRLGAPAIEPVLDLVEAVVAGAPDADLDAWMSAIEGAVVQSEALRLILREKLAWLARGVWPELGAQRALGVVEQITHGLDLGDALWDDEALQTVSEIVMRRAEIMRTEGFAGLGPDGERTDVASDSVPAQMKLVGGEPPAIGSETADTAPDPSAADPAPAAEGYVPFVMSARGREVLARLSREL